MLFKLLIDLVYKYIVVFVFSTQGGEIYMTAD